MKVICASYTVLKTFEVDKDITIEEVNEIVKLNAPECTSDIEWEYIEL